MGADQLDTVRRFIAASLESNKTRYENPAAAYLISYSLQTIMEESPWNQPYSREER